MQHPFFCKMCVFSNNDCETKMEDVFYNNKQVKQTKKLTFLILMNTFDKGTFCSDDFDNMYGICFVLDDLFILSFYV